MLHLKKKSHGREKPGTVTYSQFRTEHVFSVVWFSQIIL